MLNIWLFFLALAHSSPLSVLLTDELDQAMAHLGELDEAPHYIALNITDETSLELTAMDGAISPLKATHHRTLDTDLRVGTPLLDSTHELRGFSGFEGSHRPRVDLPLQPGHDDALRHIIWRELDRSYRDQSERIVMLRANQVVKAAEENPAPDFEPRTAVVETVTVGPLTLDEVRWRQELQDLADHLERNEWVYKSSLRLKALREEKTFVDSEGTTLQHGRLAARLSLVLQSQADNGDPISVFRAFDVADVGSLPDTTALKAWTDEALTQFLALRVAPRADPYSGPVLLKGKAAGVFFHEVFGHRVEGHRQKSDFEGKTFSDHIGAAILPEFIDVYDDPTLAQSGTTDLNGHYRFDDEGVAAARADLVKNGRFTGFLMGRSPIEGSAHSNGHGRRMSGYAPTSRMGNTIIVANKTRTETQLRAGLLKEVKAQGLSYGYIVADIDGGFTMTGRITPNAFNIRANTTWRVYLDGRPDELVRGIDLVGTPMVAFKSILAAGDKSEVFNGHCGAESGYVPVSAVAPAILLKRLEFQRKEKGSERPPLLKKPKTEVEGLVDALQAELTRQKAELTLPGAPEIYHLRYHYYQMTQYDATAAMGAILEESTDPYQYLGVELRVGEPEFDNTGFGGWENGFTGTWLPDGLTPQAAAQAAWRQTDQAYKQAIEHYSRKSAQFEAPEDYPGDYTMPPAHPVDLGEGPASSAETLRALAVTMSEQLSGDAAILRGEVHVGQESGSHWVVDSEGFVSRIPVAETTIRALLHVRSDDGMLLTDDRLWSSRSSEGLPDRAKLIDELTEMKEDLLALSTRQPMAEEYVGPIVFEHQAALDIYRYLLVPQLEGTPPEVPFESFLGNIGSGSGAVRLGRRVLPAGWRVVDDPTAHPDHPSGFSVDAESSPAQRVVAVTDGILREPMMSRVPRKDVGQTNGHARGLDRARLSGRVSQLHIVAPKVHSDKALHKKARNIASAYGRKGYYLIDKLQEPSTRSVGSAPSYSSGERGTVNLPLPVSVFWVARDGSRTPLRGAQLTGVQRWVLRDIVASGRLVEGTFMLPSTPGGGLYTPTQGLPTFLSAPVILVGEMEMVPRAGDPKSRPVLPHPLSTDE